MVLEDHSAVILLFASWSRGPECLNYDDKLVGMPLHIRLSWPRLSWPMHHTLKSDSMIPELRLLWLHSSKSTLGKVSLSRYTR
jgi:hypothetical protein